MRRLFLASCVAVLAACLLGPPAWAGPVTAAEEARGRLVAASRELVKYLEGVLKESLDLRDRGALSVAHVVDVRIRLAYARHGLALAEGKPEEAVKQLRAAVEFYEEGWGRLLRAPDRGGMSELQLATLRRLMLDTRRRLDLEEGKTESVVEDLYALVDACQSGLERSLKYYRAGGMTEAGVDAARRHLAYARYHLALAEGQQDEVVRELRLLRSLREKELERLQRVGPRGGVSEAEVEGTRADLLEDLVRLAVAEKNSTAALEQLRLLVKSREKRIQLLRAQQDMAGVRMLAGDLAQANWDLAAARYRLAVAANDLAASASDPVSELVR